MLSKLKDLIWDQVVHWLYKKELIFVIELDGYLPKLNLIELKWLDLGSSFLLSIQK